MSNNTSKKKSCFADYVLSKEQLEKKRDEDSLSWAPDIETIAKMIEKANEQRQTSVRVPTKGIPNYIIAEYKIALLQEGYKVEYDNTSFANGAPIEIIFPK